MTPSIITWGDFVANSLIYSDQIIDSRSVYMTYVQGLRFPLVLVIPGSPWWNNFLFFTLGAVSSLLYKTFQQRTKPTCSSPSARVINKDRSL
ncbi:hypothetical protein K503DRAFT_472064 [Rhizopogon vinicolor AM-OR11-026]|uniref:Uncharacterized protein n=1 Tax=Rhizopogon vinicolor AM-OR11-026 TaxID=1314800 RepID=A0A1B7N9V9_9AGAM|nr:hypothetical protein K503DRAFT_472064 [Rhizopogon vinicolor AM-OR11-026]